MWMKSADVRSATAGKRLRSTVEESEPKSGNEGDAYEQGGERARECDVDGRGSAGDTPGDQDESKRARRIISLKKK